MQLSDAIKRSRAEFHVSQTRAAAAAGVSVTQYQNYEYGKHEPTASVLIALADFYGVSLDYLCGRTNNPEMNR